jgi:O-antigen ligase
MTWHLSQIRRAVFWLTLFALPWQARWFQEGPLLGGFPWEQGRISMYVSWIFILFCVVLRLVSIGRPFPVVYMGQGRPRMRVFLLIIGILLLLPALFYTTAPRATFQFCVEWLMLGLFFWSSLDLSIGFKKFSIGYALSLLPSTIFGLWQYGVQMVPAIKYAGVAFQNPLVRGVSVIESGEERVLRIYGTFPHPNIFAGWLVVGILLLLLVLPLFIKRWQQYVVLCWINLFLVALILTFSRAALIALFVGGVITLCLPTIRKAYTVLPTRFIACAFIMTSLIVGFTFLQTRHLWLVRTQTSTRLEQRSVDERTQSLQDGMKIFRTHPWLGVGHGAELQAIQSLHPTTQVPPVPPHLFWLVALNEIGLIGILGVFLILFSLTFTRTSLLSVILGLDPRIHPSPISIMIILGSAFFVLSLFDHYLWTLWSGKAMLGILALTLFFLRNASRSGEDRYLIR